MVAVIGSPPTVIIASVTAKTKGRKCLEQTRGAITGDRLVAGQPEIRTVSMHTAIPGAQAI